MPISDSQFIQLVWFGKLSEDATADRVFESVFKAEATNIQRNKVLSPSKPYSDLVSGETKYGNAEILFQPGRVDLKLQEQELPSFGNVEDIDFLPTDEALYWLLDGMETSGLDFSGFSRVSAIAQLMEPVPDLAAGNVRLFDAIGCESLFEDATDLNFQIARRKKFDFDNLYQMNRVIRLNTQLLQVFQMGIVDAVANKVPLASASFNSAMLIDINTAPETGKIENSNLITIYREMVEELLRLGGIRKIDALRE